MRRLRESWLALGGSALIIALSVSSALGAGPALDAIDNVGEQVSAFARGVNAGDNETADEPDAEEQPDLEEDEQLDEVPVDTDEDTLGDDEEAADEEADEELELGEVGFDWTSIGHGACVSWHAHQDENADSDEETSAEEGTEGEEESADEPLEQGDEGYDWRNHGEFVSWWAQEGCRTAPADEEADEEACEDEAVDTDEDTLGDDEEAADEDSDEEACDDADEEADDEDEEATDEEADDEDEPGDEDFDWTTVSHGFCVSWHAHQKDNEGEEEWRNHGAYVSYWAQEGCRTAPGDSDEADEEADEAEAEAGDEDSDAKAEAKAERKAEKAERKAERKRNK